MRTAVTINRKIHAAFTLVEILVSVAVLLLMVALFAQMVSHATAITRVDSRHVDTDTQARAVLDRIAADIGRMLKRTDLDYYVKQPQGYNGHGNGHAYGHKVQNGQQGSDQIAFFCQTPAYPESGFTAAQQGSVALVAYRINEDSTQLAYRRLERMAKGMLWNSVSNTSNLNNAKLPLVFLPQTITAMGKTWYAAVHSDTTSDSQDTDYETIGPDVFRFEYYYLLKNGAVKGEPWDVTDPSRATQSTINTVRVSGTDYWSPIGLGDVQAIVAAIAVIDRTNRSLVNSVSSTALDDLASDLADFADAKGLGNPAKKIGDMEDSWNQTLATVTSQGVTGEGSKFPPAAASAIRVYSRYIDIGWQ
jgi:hypothetical protein